LEATNGHYIRNADDARLVQAIDDVLPHIPQGAAIAANLTPAVRAQLLKAMPGLKERAKTVLELIDGAAFITAK
ncbi:hypothetical protein, partial [Klebsiella pneumoniae]|uniref:hypothetical protein n=1 Tax=Klebsiella pneumoniae TaxID=573 RepID=UPI001953FE87